MFFHPQRFRDNLRIWVRLKVFVHHIMEMRGWIEMLPGLYSCPYAEPGATDAGVNLAEAHPRVLPSGLWPKASPRSREGCELQVVVHQAFGFDEQ